jgi:hypothetical protein
MKTLYEVLNMKGNSIMKSVHIGNRNGDVHANVRIEIEPYDDTFVNVYNKKGEDYIWEQLEKKLKSERVRSKIAESIGLYSFEGALVSLYSDEGTSEMYFKKDGINQYNIEW